MKYKEKKNKLGARNTFRSEISTLLHKLIGNSNARMVLISEGIFKPGNSM